MRKIISLITVCLFMGFIPTDVKAMPDSARTVISKNVLESRILIDRLNEIKSMDRSGMSPSEKKALRKEIREIDKELKKISGGVYISAGALIVILILLLLFV